jgi:cobalt-zinc-cadmium efflux system membrane fusion protein
MAALEARLRLYGIDPVQLNTTNLNAEMRLRAPVSGVVTDIMTSPGTFLSPGQPLCTISDRSQMHADFWLYEKDRHAIKLKQAVLVQMAGEAAVNGSVLGIDPVVDPNQHAIRVHVQGAWPAHWPQGAYVTAQLEHTTTPQNAILLPDEAVMQQDEGHFIFVYVRADSASAVFEKIPVLVQRNTKGQLLVVPQLALPAGALPVLKGAYYIAANAAGVTIEE